MSDHRERLTEHFVMPILDADTLERLSDKADFAHLCTENAVATPRTEVVDLAPPREPGWQPPDTDLPFPVVMKAARTADMAGVRFADKQKVWFVPDQQELSRLLRDIASAGLTVSLFAPELHPGYASTDSSRTVY